LSSDKIGRQNWPILSFVCHQLKRICSGSCRIILRLGCEDVTDLNILTNRWISRS